MALVNSLLIRWAGGYHRVDDDDSIATYGRCEAYLALGAVNDVATAEAIARSLFELEAAPMVALTAGVEPTGPSDTPYEAYDIGDTVTAPTQSGGTAAQRVMALAVSEDDNGGLTFTPTFDSLIQEADLRLQSTLKSMANGTVGGTVQVAQPIAPTQNPAIQPQSNLALEKLWSFGGGLFVTSWGTYKAQTVLTLNYINVELDQASTSGSVTLQLLKNGVVVPGSAVTIAAGATEGSASLSTSVTVGDKLEMQCTAAGTGVVSGVIQVGYS